MWRILWLLAMVTFLQGCAWKAYDPKTHGMVDPSVPRPTPTPRIDMEKYPAFQKMCIARAVGVFGLRVLEETPDSVVFLRPDGAQATVRFTEVFTGRPEADAGPTDALLARGPWEMPALSRVGVEPRLYNEAQFAALQKHLEGGTAPPDVLPWSEEVVPGLHVFLVQEVRVDGRRFLINRAQARQSGLTGAALVLAAGRNVNNRLGQPSISRGTLGTSPLLMILDKDAPVRLLSRDVLLDLERLAGGPALVAVPTHHSLIAVAASDPQSQAWIKNEARQRSLEPDGLSGRVYELKGGLLR